MFDRRPRAGPALAGLLLVGLTARANAAPDGGPSGAPPEAVVTTAPTVGGGAAVVPATPIPSTEPPDSYRVSVPARGWLPALVLLFGVLVVAAQVFARGRRSAGELVLTVVIVAALFAAVTGVEGAPLAALTGLLGVITGFTLGRIGRGG